MLERSLKHDNLVAGHYLDQEPEAAKAREGGEAQYQLEDEPLTLRIQWVRICSKALALPVCTACLLYCAGSVNRLLTVLMFALAGVRLVTPVALKTGLLHLTGQNKCIMLSGGVMKRILCQIA